MRDSLKRSLAHTPAQGFDRYPKGSVVLCNACQAPIFRLDTGIAFGDRCGRMASAFKPVDAVDLETLVRREDIDAGVRALVRGWTDTQRREFLSSLREVRSGDPMACPRCGDCFVQVVSVDKSEALDRSYTVELLTIPPLGAGRPVPVRGKSLGVNGDWIN